MPAVSSPDRPTRPSRSDFGVRWPLTTRWADNDVYGHVNNVVYHAFFDTAVNGWLMAETGLEIRDLPALGVVAATACRFPASLSFPEPVECGIALDRLGTSSVASRLALFGAAPEAVATGRFVHVYVDAATRRPVPVPDAVRAALATLI